MCRNTKADEWRFADMHVHGIDVSNVSVSINEDRTGAGRRRRKKHEGGDGNVSGFRLRL